MRASFSGNRRGSRTDELNKKNYELNAEVAQRRRVERELIESESRYRALVENTLEGRFVLGYTSGRFLFMNKSMRDLFGLSDMALEQICLGVLFDPHGYTELRKDLHALLGGTKPAPASGVYNAVRTDGTGFRAEIMISEIQFNGMRAAQGFVRDVTGEEKLRRKLQQAYKMEAVGTLAGGLAHDFNNLLTAISCSASLIALNLKDGDSLLEYARNIERHVQSGAENNPPASEPGPRRPVRDKAHQHQ